MLFNTNAAGEIRHAALVCATEYRLVRRMPCSPWPVALPSPTIVSGSPAASRRLRWHQRNCFGDLADASKRQAIDRYLWNEILSGSTGKDHCTRGQPRCSHAP